jgi:hypothetical protein
VKVLFLGRHYTYFRNFDSVLRELAARGHRIHLASERGDPEGMGGVALVEALAAANPSITYGEAPGRADDRWTWTAGRLRLGLDHLRYQHPIFDRASKLRERSRKRTPRGFVLFGGLLRRAGKWSQRLGASLVRRLERAVPDDPAIRAFIEEQDPDLVLLTPLINLGSSQIDYLRAARALGIPTALCVWSWDHLSSKALIRECPDRVIVWNETQKREAMELHGVPGDRVIVTGAQCFDQWFDRQPSRSRAEFCRAAGLPSDGPYLLWVCSALVHGSPQEAPFVVDWIRALRSSGSPRLRDVNILVRPHPSRVAEWEGVDLSGQKAVVWGGNPVDGPAKADYFDSLAHSAAVIGINTSAFIEAGIAGRPVYTVIEPEMRDNQTGTVHFDYLVSVGGGLLNVADTFGAHIAQLDAALARPRHGVMPFIREFVRPHGLDRPATPIFVEQVEAMAGMQVVPAPADSLRPFWSWVVGRIAWMRDKERLERWVLSRRELESARRIRNWRRQRAEHEAASPERAKRVEGQ